MRILLPFLQLAMAMAMPLTAATTEASAGMRATQTDRIS